MLRFIVLICLLLSSFAYSEGVLNKLFAPGPLIEGHKDLEKDGCLQCHDVNSGVPNKNCMECHDEIKQYVIEKRGFHGLQSKRCFECHTDHKGSDFDSTWFDTKTFNHKTTGYELTGKHADIKCIECHKEKRTKKHLRKADPRFLGVKASCKECHNKDDIHYFKGDFQKKDCNACHGTKSWKENVKFNHNTDTKHKLYGKHAKLKCTECHIVNKTQKISKYHWDGLKHKQCLSCHKEVHGNRLSKKFRGGQCATCHNQDAWKIYKFDHREVTGFRLKAKHAEIKCIDCHKQSKDALEKGKKYYNWTGLKTSCISCHGDAQHAFGSFKSKNKLKLQNCETCHNEYSWKKNIKFNHNYQTHFKIDGKHLENKCHDCHKPEKKKKGVVVQRKYHWKYLSTKTCNVCHKSPHDEFSPQFRKKKCTDCHTTRGWHLSPKDFNSKFDHDDTRFPLTGQHKKQDCNTCHNYNGKQKFKFENSQVGFCIDCHKSPHNKQFHKKFSSQSCTECHTTNNFTKRKAFDHDETAFNLKGKHAKLNCFECHKKDKKSKYVIFKKKSKIVKWHKYIFKDLKTKQCTTCHNDVHVGQLGKDCKKCHSDERPWKKLKFNHNTDSQFLIRGKHKKVKCLECHKALKGKYVRNGKDKVSVRRWKPINTDCYTCHKKDDHHKGAFGKKCQSCHNEGGWKTVKDFHKHFTLSGIHYSLDCAECHSDNRKLGGMSQNCMLCHQKDDVHSGQLFDCNECHRQNFWEHTKFRHSITSFPLRGIHRTLDCFQCHSQGVYTGLNESCTSCHVNDVDNSVFNHSTILNVQDCNECHNQFSF